MAGMLEFDHDAARRVEAAYTTPDIAQQRAGVVAALALRPGERVLDVGVGPGFLAAEIAARPSAATQGTVRAIWESLDRPYRAAMEQGLIYTRLGNPIGMAEVARKPPAKRTPRIR